MEARLSQWRGRLPALGPLAPYVLLFAVSLALHWTYLLEPGRPLYVDSNLPLTYEAYVDRYFTAWNANNDHFAFASFMRVPYVLGPYLVFRGLGLDPALLAKFLFWLPTFLGMAAGYVFFRAVLGDRRAVLADRLAVLDDRSRGPRLAAVCVLLAVFYGLSPWITKHFLHYFFRVSYAVLPLAFLYFVRFVNDGERRDLLVTGLLVAVFVGTNPHFLVYFSLLAGLYVLFEGLLSRRLLATAGRGAGAAGIAVAFSLFWLLPFVYVTVAGESVIGYNVGERIVSQFSARQSPVNLFSMMGGYWSGITARPWWLFDPIEHYQTVFLAIPAAALVGFLATDREDRFALFSGVTIVLILALATGYKYGGPVARVYDLILELPFHGVLRAPGRLQALLPLLYGYLVGRAILDGDSRLLRGGATALLVVICAGVVLMNLPVFGLALAPVEVPDDHQHVAEAGYEDTFVSPPRPLGGYNPDWMFSREGGIVDSWDTHLYARPDTRQHYLNYYVFELIDRNRTATAIDVLRKTGGNHVAVRTDTRNRQGVPPPAVSIARLDEHLSRAYTGDNVVVFDLEGPADPFRVIRPAPAPRDVDAGRPFADDPGIYPTYPPRNETGATVADLHASARFHPANTFARINELDALSRPPTYEGVTVHGIDRIDPPERNGTLEVYVSPLNRAAELVWETESGRHVYKPRAGMDRVRVDLADVEGTIGIRGPMYLERITVEDEPVRREGLPIETSFHSTGTLTPELTSISVVDNDSALDVEYSVQLDGSFLQASFEPERDIAGPFEMDVSVSAAEGGDRIGLVLLRDEGRPVFAPSGQRLRPGRQNVTFHVPELPDSRVSRIQLAVFPTDRPTSDELTLHDVDLVSRAPSPLVADMRPNCNSDPAGPRCEGAAEVTNVEQVSPTRYELTVDAESHYALHFGETYGPLWAAEVDGPDGSSTYGARPVYLATNGFWINETGEHVVTVRYRPQQWFHAGAVVSGIAGLAAVAYLLVDWRRRRDDDPFRRLYRRGRRQWRATRTAVTDRLGRDRR